MIFNKGNYISTLPCGNQCSQMCYSNVTKKDTEEYIDILLQNGYVKKDFLDINNNLFVTLFNENKLVNLSYTDYNGNAKTEDIQLVNYNASGSMKKAVITSMVVADARQILTVDLKDASGNVLLRTQDSIEEYLARRGTPGEIESAFMKFSDAAYALLHK